MSTITGHRDSSACAVPPPSRGPGALARVRVATGLREVALLASLWIAYSASRLVADDDLDTARQRAASILHLEHLLHLDVEARLNHALTPITQVAVPMSYWYASLHYLVTPAVLVWLFSRHRADYSRARTALVIGSAIGLACYLLIPTAPPRLMPGGDYLDALARTAQLGWWSGHASAPAGLGHLTNELAAMPSLHVGWTVWVAWAVWRHTTTTGRAVAVTYALGTTLVVVATGNHWALDAVAGAVVVAAGVLLSGRLEHRHGLALETSC
ncbi:MAG: inositol phosphorylceramide synthase [Aeromicrobium sp.]|nr:inositol phosphorylceramide synthase [Aeromicrobium sp.]